ncbi:hypothetical protein FITA111629_11060 [Filibacter tadaridae]|uniref:Uncharacterized protein n=1 Tax=Filibacter tadaridae TaxID=2483811 RepID=A0A3P5WUJ2_9BACL|nr:hypothetical protein FILTAD_01140 [Filibacter tadaridae]
MSDSHKLRVFGITLWGMEKTLVGSGSMLGGVTNTL